MIFLLFKEHAGLKNFFILFFILGGIYKRRIGGLQNSQNMEYTELPELYLNHLSL